MTRQVIMVFFGEARWDEARPSPPSRHGRDGRRRVDTPHGARPRPWVTPHESPWLDAGCRSSCWPSAPSSAASSTCRSPSDELLDQLARAGRRGRRAHVSARPAEDVKWVARSPWPRSSPLVGIVARPTSSTSASRVKAVEPERPGQRLVLRPDGHRVHGRTRARGASRASACVRRATSSTARSTAPASGVRASRAARCAGARPATSATTPLGIGVGAVLLLGWFVARGVLCAWTPRSRSSPRIIAAAGASARSSSRCCPSAGPSSSAWSASPSRSPPAR